MVLSRRRLIATPVAACGGTILPQISHLFGYSTRASDSRTELRLVEIEVMRKYVGPACNSGYIAIHGLVVAYTLERPTVDNQPLFSAVPAGTYSAHLRYDHNDHWRFELEGVPGRSNVQIHVGNTIDNTIGCVLIGTALGAHFCSLSQSRAAYAAFKKAVYDTADDRGVPPEVGATVIIADPG